MELEIGACEAALGRLDRGCFGVCEQCGEFIETNRLVASPSESLCLSCRLKSPV
ncbi:TraR/DksA C4-type zinc finger protein [Marinobacterium aestuariivivens]|uniref:TraR/DksA C4-type zinc finger protein n=1 Tax=Marinobacterium aestuariivivens TaxID=1698799 RepID=A0ABW2A4L3_9GAMM